MIGKAYEITLLLLFVIYLTFNLLSYSNIGHTYHATLAETIYKNDSYTIDSLFIALLTNGDATIDYNLAIDPDVSNANVSLFGRTIQNLTLTDYNGTSIRYFTTENPNKIIVNSKLSSDIHVSYTTPDFVDKQDRNWTFSFFFGSKFLLKFPAEARITTMQPQPYLTPTYEQNLWGFGPGNVEVKYIIGPLGTREEAQASIRLTEEDVLETKKNYRGIILTDVASIMKQTKQAFEDSKYLDAITYATLADELLKNKSNSYSVGRQAISQAQTEIQSKKDNGYDMSRAEELLANAKSLFSKGQYDNASKVAKLAINQQNSQLLSSLDYNPGITISIILGILVTVLLVLGKKTHLFNRINAKKDLRRKANYHTGDDTNLDKIISQETYVEGNSLIAHKTPSVSPIPINPMNISPSPNEAEIKQYMNKVVQEVNSVRIHNLGENTNKSPIISPPPPESSIDKDLLAKIVSQMKSKNPHLKPEEKELLDFLVEKSGSAFESEVRSKFILPRTSLWRLVKRLEREEMIDVSKIGGQNLVKLRVEVPSNEK